MNNESFGTEKKDLRRSQEQREFEDFEYRERFMPLIDHGLILASDARRMGIARPEWMGTI